MKKYINYKILSFFLAFIMIFSSISFDFTSAAAETQNTGAVTNYGSVIGNTAKFDLATWSSLLVHNNPQSFVYEGDGNDWDNSEYWLNCETTNENPDVPDDHLFVITDYYFDEGNAALWYQVEAAPGYTLPEKMAQYSWVFQDYTSELAAGNQLIIADSGKNFVFDNSGNLVTAVTLPLYDKITLTTESTLQGAVEYAWQILADPEDGLWIDIYNETEPELTLSLGMVATVLDSSYTAQVRSVATSGSKRVTGDAIPVTIQVPEPTETPTVEPTAEPEATATPEPTTAAAYGTNNSTLFLVAEDVTGSTEEDTSTEENVSEEVTVTIKFVYGSNGNTVSADKTYEIQKNANITDTFTLPEMEGYDAYLEDDTTTIYTTYDLNLTNVTENTVITFKYWPAKVNYTVIYYWQNVDDDDYTEHERYTDTDFTGNTTSVASKSYDGFYQLLYETVPIASDGSTVIEVYYDRLYYKMTFNLDGGYGVQPIYARYGTEVDVPTPTKAGYTFVGWDDITSGTEDGIADTLPTTIPAYHSAYKAIWEPVDNAKVTIVYWGENANDEEYSYIKSQELYVTPGTELTFGSGQLVCALDEHTHDETCGNYTCGLEEHTHSTAENCYNCDGSAHEHSADCYSVTFTRNRPNGGEQTTINLTLTEVTDPALILNLDDSEYWNTSAGIVRLGNRGDSQYYIKLDGTWYQLTGDTEGLRDNTDLTVTTTCGQTEHTHDESCLSCTKTEHTHNASCSRECGEIAHIHTDDCYLNTNSMDSTLWTYKESDTVTVAADGSTVMNVYYDRTTFTLTFHYNYSGGNNGSYSTTETITDKWGADIGARFLQINTNAKGNLWSTDTSGDSPWTSYLQIMPQGNEDYYCRHTSTETQSAEYYTQKLDGTYELEYTVDAYYSEGTLTISKEDFYEMEGYTYSHGTDGEGDSMPTPGSYGNFDGAKFYYTRNSYTLEFNNGEGVVKTESVLYEASLDGYGFTPTAPSYYEPGSVEFAGWYLNPECTGEQYILSEHTMPASNVLLYAKWTPVVHTVRFYLEESLVGTDSIYSATVDGEVIEFVYDDIPHGSLIQDPHDPPNDPTKGRYIFVGWFYIDDQGNEQMWDFENTIVTRDVDIYAKWSSNTLMPYEVRFVYIDTSGNEIEIADPITGSALGGNSKTFEAKGNDQLYAGYQTGYFPTVQSHTITIDLEDTTKNTYTFYYEKWAAVPYKVYYLDAETNENVVGTDGIEVTPVTHSDNTKAIVTETYVHVPGYLPDTYQQTLIIDPDGENVIIFYYTQDDVNGMYVVHYWTENLDGSYSEHSIFEGGGEKGSEVTATLKTIENFTYYAAHQNTKLSGTISTDTVLELHVYYERNTYPYKVQYLEQGTNKVLAEEKLVNTKMWEETVTEKAITIADYTLVSADEVTIQIRKDTTNPTVNIITFYYTQKKVNLNYVAVVEGSTAENTGCAVTPSTEEVKILTGTAQGSTATPGTGYRFVGWYSDEDCTQLLTTETTYAPTKADGEKWENGTTFYAKFEPATTSLTIDKIYPEGADYSIDVNQTFIFDIVGEGISLTVTVHGDGEITITDLPIGNYTITEQTNWSWRYGDSSEGSDSTKPYSKVITLVADPSKNKITFENTRQETLWLDGDSYAVNVFTGTAE